MTKTEYELSYWRHQALTGWPNEKPSKYRAYLDYFGLAPDDLTGKVVADVGAGPRGGILSVIAPSVGVVVDPLISEYVAAGVYSPPPGTVSVERHIQALEPGDLPVCDFIVCTNALDHHTGTVSTGEHLSGIDTMTSALRVGGTLLVHVHCRAHDDLDFGHDTSITAESLILKARSAGLWIHKSMLHACDPVAGGPWPTLVVRCTKEPLC